MKLSFAERLILKVLSDGSRHNLFAYPLVEEHDDFLDQARLIWAAAWLTARGLVTSADMEDDELWMEITPAGLEAWRSVP